MKNLQKLCAAAVLLFALNLSTLAGDIHTPKTEPPPPSPSAGGEILIPPTSSEDGAVDPTVGIALSLLQSVLGLF